MAATTIRLDSGTKAELDRLQAMVQLKRGDRLSHAELVAELLKFVRAHESEFVDDAGFKPWTAKQRAALQRLGTDWGGPTSSEDIDEVLYGGDRP
ncbi:MAG: hypothetical protein ACT4PT_00935 [Methanobacteriota archaeon]